VVHGASGSGVTGTLAVAASQAAAAGMEVHVLDPAGDLGAHDGGRHWSSCTDPADRRQLEVLVECLRAPRVPDTTTVVAIDRWHATSAALDDLDGARLLDQLVRLLAQGPSAGIVGLVGLDRATGLPAPLAPAAAQRIVLRLGDPHDVGLVGVPLPPSARRLLVHAPPGRGIATPAGLEVQVARP
jgi:S-DNA-T family DNA segregation ATPase FtsK/SpoIIIE